MTSEPIVQIKGLTKRYPGSSTPALSKLDLSIQPGEIFGYLGPNGAGKTTTIRLMLNFIRPSAGSVSVLGLDANRHSTRVRQQVGNLPGELNLWEHLTGRHTLRYLAGLRPGCDLDYAYELAAQLDLDLDIRCGSYSTGNKRKLGIVQAMMHRPPLLILDEPTTGLDPLARQTFHEMLATVRSEGRTVFLSSHILSEVQAICDRVGILRGGVLQTVMPVAHLSDAIERRVTVYSPDPLHVDQWADLEGVVHAQTGPGFIRLRVSGSLDPVVKFAARHRVDDLQVETSGLEDLFMKFYDNRNGAAQNSAKE
jgi:ABC-2 type transport system ATP-binding protein